MKRRLIGVYLVEFEGGGIKVGWSKNILERVKTYKHPWCQKIKTIGYRECCFPQLVEYTIKRIFKNFIGGDGSTEYISNISFAVVLNRLNRLAKKTLKYLRSRNSISFKKKRTVVLEGKDLVTVTKRKEVIVKTKEKREPKLPIFLQRRRRRRYIHIRPPILQLG